MVVLDIPLAISAVLGGTLADRFGVGRVWAFSSGLAAAGSLLMPLFGAQPVGFVALRLMQGCGVGPIVATIPLAVAQWFPGEERGTVFGISTAMAPLGTAIGTSFVPAVFQYTGSWQAGMAWAAVFPLLAMVLSSVIASGPRPPINSCPSLCARPVASWKEFRGFMLMPVTWAVAICYFFAAWQTRVFNSLTPSYLAVNPPVGAGLGALRSGTLISGSQIPFVVGALLCGPITERLFRGRPRALVMIGFLLCTVFFYSLGIQRVASSIAMTTVCLWLVSFAMSIIGPQVMTFVAKNYPEPVMGKLGGVLIGGSTVGGVVGAGISAYALHVTRFYNLSIDLFAGASLIGLLAATRLTAPPIFYQWAADRSLATLTPVPMPSAGDKN
jgi:MFS family permease